MESILGNAFSSILEGHNSKFFSSLSAHHGGASAVTKYVTNAIPRKSLGTVLLTLYEDKSLFFIFVFIVVFLENSKNQDY